MRCLVVAIRGKEVKHHFIVGASSAHHMFVTSWANLTPRNTLLFQLADPLLPLALGAGFLSMVSFSVSFGFVSAQPGASPDGCKGIALPPQFLPA